jgi:hypothetical protein
LLPDGVAGAAGQKKATVRVAFLMSAFGADLVRNHMNGSTIFMFWLSISNYSQL